MSDADSGAIARFQSITLDIARSLAFDKEAYLVSCMEKLGLTKEEFVRDYVLEEYPVELTWEEYSVNQSFPDVKFTVHQEFRIRHKDEGDYQLEIESNEEKNVDPDDH